MTGRVQPDADPATWTLLGEGGTVLAMFYVDDSMTADTLVELVAWMFSIRAPGEPEDLIAIKISCDWAAGDHQHPPRAQGSRACGRSLCRREEQVAVHVAGGVLGAAGGVQWRRDG